MGWARRRARGSPPSPPRSRTSMEHIVNGFASSNSRKPAAEFKYRLPSPAMHAPKQWSPRKRRDSVRIEESIVQNSLRDLRVKIRFPIRIPIDEFTRRSLRQRRKDSDLNLCALGDLGVKTS